MNSFLALFLLGLIQGLTEFLPVSSSGHLVLFSKIFGIEESLFISILLHVATLLSIVFVFRKDVWQMITHPFSQKTFTLVIATIPTCIIVILLMPIFKQSFSGVALPLCFAISAVLLAFSEFIEQKKIVFSCDGISYKSALIMGVFQGLAVFPGISRSGATISGGLISGAKKSEVAKFSFLMSVPIVILSLFMEIFEIFSTSQSLKVEILPTALAFLTAFLVGIFAIKVMIKLTVNSSLKWFSAYLVLISVVSLFFM